MTASLTYPHIRQPEGQPACLERLPRIRVAQIVMGYLAHGWSPDEMCRQYPHLRLSEVHAAMAYYYDHQDTIDAEIQVEVEAAEQGRAAARSSPFFLRMRAQGLL